MQRIIWWVAYIAPESIAPGDIVGICVDNLIRVFRSAGDLVQNELLS